MMTMKRQMNTVKTRAVIKSSKSLTGFPRVGLQKPRMRNTSTVVTSTPAHNGRVGNSITSAVADPSSSARSVLTMAISATAYRGYRMHQR